MRWQHPMLAQGDTAISAEELAVLAESTLRGSILQDSETAAADLAKAQERSTNGIQTDAKQSV